MLKVVADEAVRGALKAMESLVQQTSRLNLGSYSALPGSGPRNARATSVASGNGSQSGFTSGNASDTSGALRTGEEPASLGYVYEYSDLESQPLAQPSIGPLDAVERTLGLLLSSARLTVLERRLWLDLRMRPLLKEPSQNYKGNAGKVQHATVEKVITR